MRITNIFQRAIQVDGETSTSNYVLAQAGQVRPRFDISPKLRLEGTLEYAMQEFRGDPGIFAGLSASTRDDKLRSAAFEASYRASYNATVNFSPRQERRISNFYPTTMSTTLCRDVATHLLNGLRANLNKHSPRVSLEVA